MKVSLFAAGLLMFSLRFACADELTVLQENALQANPALEAARRTWEAAQARVGGERSLPDPMVGADWERDSTRFSDRMDVEYMVQQDLPGWGKRGAKTKAARLAAEAEGFRYLEEARGLRSEVAQAWWELWARTRSVEAMGGNVASMRHMEQAALSRYEIGGVMLSEVLRVQASLARMSNELVTMEREVDLARTDLNRLVNAPPGTLRSVPEEPTDPVLPPSLEALQQRARQYCCILLSFVREQESKAAAVRAARVERRPDWQLRVEGRQLEGSNGAALLARTSWPKAYRIVLLASVVLVTATGHLGGLLAYGAD